MSKQRITADNFEQLIEIVKAVQRGKNPEEALLEKDFSDEEPAAEPESRTPEEQKADEQKFDRLLNPGSRPDLRQEDRGAGKSSVGETELPEKQEPESGSEKSRPGTKRIRKERAGEFVWPWSRKRTDREKTAEKSSADRGVSAEKPETENTGAQEGRPAADDNTRQETGRPLPDSNARQKIKEPVSGGATREETEGPKEPVPGGAVREETEGPREPLSGGAVREETEGPREPLSGGAAGEKAEGSKKTVKSPGTFFAGLRDRAVDLRRNLAEKGLRRRELVMVVLGVLLAVLVIFMIVRSVTLSQIQKRKMEHVTADEGLIVLVEKEPEQWCRSYPVELTIRTKNEATDRAEVNGTSYMLDEQGRLTVEVTDPLVEISVETSQGTLRAQAEIAMIDAQPPVVYPARVEDQITLTAADARSEISRIRYAVVHKNQYFTIPLYEEYREPFPFEKDCVYYFYAQDQAGNRCEPVSTTMEMAESLSLGSEEITLFPGETAYLEIKAEPEGALLNNLQCTSADTGVVTAENSGRLTAVAEGNTVVTVRADGLGEVTCQVAVSETRTVTISAVGDCTLGTDVNFNSETSFTAFDIVNGHSWFFRNVKDILSGDDATFANLEGTLTEETQREEKEYAFRGDPSYVQILQDASIDVVTLANNHSSDYGPQSLTDTKQYLTEAGVDYCMENEIALKEVNGIRTAFIGIYVLDDGMASEKELREAIAEAQAQKAQLIIVAFHWGSERATSPDETQRELAHIAVDCGASLVVGHHPHVLQGIEKYNGVYIVYSLGNFCFGGNSTPSDMDTMIFRQNFTVSRDGVLDDDQIEIIPCSISSTDYYNNYQPTPAQGTEAERILGRVNEYSAEFGMNFAVSDDSGGDSDQND